MEYIKRTFNILSLPFKCLFKVFAVLCLFTLCFIHFCVSGALVLPIFILQLIELLTVCPIYYIVTGKKYHEKYNQITNMAVNVIFLDRPYYIKSNEPKHASYIEHALYGKDSDYYDNDFYTRLWRKIMKISLKLNYE